VELTLQKNENKMKGLSMLAALCCTLGTYAQEDTAVKKTTDSVLVDTAIVQAAPQTETPARFTPPATRKDVRQDDDGANRPVYKLKPAVDIPVVLAGTAWSIYGFSQIYNKPTTSEARINSLRVSDINGFDRWAADLYSEKASDASDLFFYGSMPAPVLLFIDKKIRKDALKVAFLYWETMAVTGVFYTGTAHIVDRYRPLAYNPAAPMSERTSGNARNSFLGGHPALVASSTFFMAKVYADYHPESKFKWVLYTVATGATLTTAYLRHRAGKHFPSDLLVGMTVGTASGILVPHFHKHRLFKNPNVSLRPFSGESHGLVFTYKM
jgi:membrane-associated phospholipid phosphatase